MGRAGTILTTTDGMNWTRRFSGARHHFRAAAASGSTVVVVGSDGDIVTSLDNGITWTFRSSGAVEWTAVVQGGGVWVASGYGGGTWRIRTSPDGLTWTERSVPNAGGSYFHCSVWTGTRFVVGGYGLGATALVTSEDGVTWEG